MAKVSNVYQYFVGFLEGRQSTASTQHQIDTVDAEVSDAYKFFGISEDASDDDVKRAWRRKIKKSHPDIGSGESDSLNALAKDINRRYDLIKNARNKK